MNKKLCSILIINDSPSLNELLKLTLEAGGFLVGFAETGINGLREAKEWQYDLFLLDYTLPDINGVEVCRKLRKEKLTSTTPIAFITGMDKDRIYEEIIDAGADAYINPPFRGPAFIDIIKKLIEIGH